MANNSRVNNYLENLEKVLRVEMDKYRDMDYEDAIKECGAALAAVDDLKKRINGVENVKRAYLVV